MLNFDAKTCTEIKNRPRSLSAQYTGSFRFINTKFYINWWNKIYLFLILTKFLTSITHNHFNFTIRLCLSNYLFLFIYFLILFLRRSCDIFLLTKMADDAYLPVYAGTQQGFIYEILVW